MSSSTTTTLPQDLTLLAPIVEFINKYHPFSPEAMLFIGSKMKQLHVKKGEILHEPGSIGDELFFIVKGIVRSYIIDNGKEVTTWIVSENELVSSLRSYLLRIPTRDKIEALEDCHLISLHYNDMQELFERYPETNTTGRKIVELYYAYAEDRALLCRLSKAEERYNYFMQDNSHLINRIPLTYIASYLNMTLETLSRLRSKLAKKKSPTI